MTDRPSAPDLLRDWARAPVPLDDASADVGRRARVVRELARTIREAKVARERKRNVARVALVLAAAAAVAVLIGGLWRGVRAGDGGDLTASVRPASTGVLVVRGSESKSPPVHAEQRLQKGDVVSTVVDARASLRLASGAEANVAPSTRVVLARAEAGEEQMDLSVGELAVRVPPLGDRGSFRVQTPDALVTVHGTAFVVRVTKRDAEATVTDVSVSEGKVSVDRGGSRTFLLPGQSWSSKETAAARPDAPTAPAPPSVPALPPSAAPAKPAAPSGKLPALARTDPSALAEQNRLLSAAAAARRQGDDPTQLAHLNQLLSRFPDGPLAPEARVERFRALKRLGRDAEAAREARRYLLDHQSGAARDEARGVALDPK